MSDSKARFRSPLRNEWERVRNQFEASAKKMDHEGAIARLMLDLMPAFIAAIERERDNHTAPKDFFSAVGAVCGALIEEAIEKQNTLMSPRASLHHMLGTIEAVVAPRVVKQKSSLILPGQF